MRNKIKEYLCRKRFKVKMLKNNKGFSLLEVLVAVSIIGIISAIAVPQFKDYRKRANITAGSSTVSNIQRAYNNCIVLNDHSSCDTLEEIKISCTACKSTKSATKFCGQYTKKIGATTFNMCVEIEGDTVKKNVGGIKICNTKCAGTSCPTEYPNGGTAKVFTPFKSCEKDSDCTEPVSVTNATYTNTCPTAPVSPAGECSAAGACQ